MKNEKGIGRRIRLNEVTKFASGTFGRGKKQHFVLWAFGKTGWFEIRPSQKYQAVYDEMIEGVKLFYFLCDQYSTRRNQKRPSAKQTFKAYAATPGSPCATAQEAQQTVYKHYHFLISEMINDTQEIGWDKAPIFKDLVDTFPEAAHNIRMRTLDSSDEESQETEDGTSAGEAQKTSDTSEPAMTEPKPKPEPEIEAELLVEMQTPKAPKSRKRARPRQSVLRPTSSRPVKSAKSRGKVPVVSHAESSTDSEAEESKEPEQDSGETEDDADEDDDASSNEADAANGVMEPEIDGILTTERVKIVQSEGQRGARVGNLLEFVLNRAAV